MNYWLMKTEPQAYSIDDLKRDKKTAWGGVRNYQARNFMMRDMEKGDLVLFYHSSSKPTGVYGVGKVSSTAHPDVTQFDTRGQYYEPKATKEKPIWYCVEVAFVKKFKDPISLDVLKFDPKLEGMRVRERGLRLSIQPVSEKHFRHIVESMV